MSPISLDEDWIGYDPTEVFIPNIIICGAVLIRLNTGGFVGMHFTPHTTTAEITAAANYAAAHLVPIGGGIRNLVFFVSTKDWGADKVAAESNVLQTAFGVAPTLLAKPNNLAGQTSVDLRIHTPVSPQSASWIGIRPHEDGYTPVTPNAPNVFKISRLTTPPSVVPANFQRLPANRDPGSFLNI